MIAWIIVLAAVLAILFIAKLSHLKHKLSIIALIGFVLIVMLTFMKVANTNSLDVGSTSGFFSGVKLYFSWLGNAFNNFKVLTGNVVRMDWFSNSTG